MISITNNEIIICGYKLVSYDYYNYSRIPLLINSLFNLQSTNKFKKIHIEFVDSPAIKFSGLDHIINLIIAELNLTPDQLVITTVDKSYINSVATVKYRPTPYFELVRSVIPDNPTWQTHNNSVLFGAVFGRFSIDRFLLASFLETKLKQDSFVIFQPTELWMKNHFDSDCNFKELYKEQLSWYNNKTKVEQAIPTNQGPGGSGGVHWKNSTKDYVNIWPKYKIEIVAETDPHNKYQITEKTTRCLITKKPFIIMSGCGVLQHLKNLGFQTFDPWINESYDQEPIVNQRLQMIQQEILRIAQLSESDKSQMFIGIQSALDYNQSYYDKIVYNYYKHFKNDSCET